MSDSLENSISDSHRGGWVQRALSWSTINKARARIAGSVEQAPSHVDDIEIHSISRQLLAWWMEARGDRVMPGPEDVSPRALVELLPYIRLLQWEGEEELVFRIFGSALVEAAGFDLTGYNSIAAEGTPGRADDIARLKLLHSEPCGALFHREMTRADGSVYICEFMNLPISAGPDGKTRVIGSVIPREEISEASLKIELTMPLTLRRAAFIDIGQGLSEKAKAMCV